MRVFRDFQDLSPTCLRQPRVTVGFFDGVHRGHLHLFDELRLWAGRGADAVAVTFTAPLRDTFLVISFLSKMAVAVMELPPPAVWDVKVPSPVVMGTGRLPLLKVAPAACAARMPGARVIPSVP